MEIDIRDNLGMIKWMARENYMILRAIFSLVNGLMGEKMENLLHLKQMDRL